MSVIKQSLLFLFFSIMVNAGAFYAGIKIPPAYEAAVYQDLKSELKRTEFADNPEGLIQKMCSHEDAEYATTCLTYDATQILPYTAVGTFTLTIAALFFVHVLGSISSRNRKTLLKLFKPGLWIAKSSACLLMALNIVLIIFSLFSYEYLLSTKIHLGLMLSALGFGAYALGMIIYRSFKSTESEVNVFGMNLIRSEHTQLWAFVEDIAKQLDAPLPDNIVVGLSPSFYVTQAPIFCVIQKKDQMEHLTGRTLYLSLQLCRILSKTELSCIIAHELGHYAGEDTEWTLKFAPIYVKIEEAIQNMDGDDNAVVLLAQAPARLLMKIFLSAFEKSVNTINRDRELAADALAAKLYSPEQVAAALVKTHIFESYWGQVSLLHPKYYGNLSIAFQRICREMASLEIAQWQDILMEHTTHPMDTHPTLSARLDNLGVAFEQAFEDVRDNLSNSSANDVIDNVELIEETISNLFMDGIQLEMPEGGWLEFSEEQMA